VPTTSNTALQASSFRVAPTFARLLVIVNGGVPLLILGWDALHHQLGVNGIKFAIHTTGLLGLLFLLLSLTITPLRRLTGWSVLIAPRRALGLYGFFYLALHFAIFFGFDRAASVSSTVHEILTRRYLQLGAIALLLLVPLALTSTDAMLTRLGAKRWKALHRLSYVATTLGVIHYYMQVKADVRKPLVFAGVLFLLLAFRVGQRLLDGKKTARAPVPARPLAAKRRFWSGELSVLRVFDETPDVRTFRLGLASGEKLPFDYLPGQYLNIALSIAGQRVNRSYTIASSPTQTQYCELTVKKSLLGYASLHLHEMLTQGATLKISAPAGRFVFTGADADSVVLIAGGVGITPLMSIVRYLCDRSWAGAIHLIVSQRTQADIVFSDELTQLQRRFANLHLTPTLSGEAEGSSWQGRRGRISAELLAAVVPELATQQIFLCGPDAMMVDTRAALQGLGVPDTHIKTEAFVSPPAGSAEARVAIEVDGTGALLADVETAETSDGVATVKFERSLQTAELPSGQTILECAEDAGIDIPFECRAGICGQCKTRLLGGRVTMEVEDALSSADRARGLILACQARASSDVVIDA
jgi:glycine betaine catabolism B